MLKHKINWDAAIKGKHIQTATNDARVVDTCALKHSVALFHCLVCKMAEMSSNPRFHRLTLDNKIKCPLCAKSSLVKDWNCLCDIPWFRCSMHAYETHQELTSPSKKRRKTTATCNAPLAKRKASSFPSTYDEILQGEKEEQLHKQARLNTPTGSQFVQLKRANLSWKPIKLPQVLLDRFPHLAS